MKAKAMDQASLPQILLAGFPGTSPRGYLGWSTIVLVRAYGQNVLFDTGGPGDRVGLLAALKKHGLDRADVHLVVLSHLHFDHALNVELFQNADVYVHRTEIEYARTHASKDLALCQWACEAIARHPRLTILDGEPELLRGLQVLHTPGHTSGCISLMLNVEGETWVLAQDAVKNRRELLTGRVEVAADIDEATSSLMKIRELADIVVPGHDVPLRWSGGRPLPLAEATLSVSEVLSGRSVSLKAGPVQS